MENWKPVPSYEELYEVSDHGNVKSLRLNRLLKPSKTTTGYRKIELYKNGVCKSFKIHRLVLYAFEGVKSDLVNHEDGNRLNNHLSNLKYCDQSYNIKHAYRTGLMKCNLYGNENRILNEYKNGSNIKKLSKKYDTTEKTIRKFLLENNVEIKSISEVQRKYDIDFNELKRMFEMGMSNVEIAKTFKTNRRLIAQYKYQMKRGRLKF